MRPSFWQDRVLWLLLLLFLIGKILYVSQLVHPGLDGSYYLDIAKNLAQGEGFTSDLSLYHQGLKTFPHPTPVYPIWPLVMAALSLVMPWPWVAHGVPAALHLLSLLLACILVVRVWYIPLLQWRQWTFHSGHVFVLMFGLHTQFFVATTRPYTEGLSYTFLFLALLRAHSLCTSEEFLQRGWRMGLEMGFWAVLLFLTRAQLLLFGLAFASVLPIAWWFGNRRVWTQISIGFGLGAAITLFPQWLHLSLSMDPFSPSWMLRFDKWHLTRELSVLPHTVQVKGLLAFLKDRWPGFGHAFDLHNSTFSYRKNFYLAHFALFPALLVWGLWAVKGLQRWNWSALKEQLARPVQPFRLFLVSFSCAGFLSIHTIHKQMFAEWNFATRHSMTCVFLFLLAMLSVAAAHRRLRPLVLVWVLLSSGFGVHSLHQFYQKKSKKAHIKYSQWHLVRWINDHSPAGKKTIFVSKLPQALAPMTPNSSYHWIHWKTTFRDLEVMFFQLKARYLIVGKTTKKYKLYKDTRFARTFRLLKRGLSGYEIYVLKSSAQRRK